MTAIPLEERLWQLVSSHGPLTNSQIYHLLKKEGYELKYNRVATIGKKLVDSGKLDRQKRGVYCLP